MIPGKHNGSVTHIAATAMKVIVATKTFARRHHAVVWIGVSSAIMAVLLLEAISMLYRDGFCSPDDKTQSVCLREWIGAFSGWAGAAAAAFTLIILYQQIKDQRKQTAYAIGEAEPDFLIERKSYSDRCTLRVVNFCRHNIVIDRITVIRPSSVRITQIEVDHLSMNIEEPRALIKGTINRTASPQTREIVINFADRLAGCSTNMMNHQLELGIDYRKIGQNHSRHYTTTSALNQVTM